MVGAKEKKTALETELIATHSLEHWQLKDLLHLSLELGQGDAYWSWGKSAPPLVSVSKRSQAGRSALQNP